MKVGGIEGTSTEITDVFIKLNVKLDDYLVKPEAGISRWWVISPAVILFIIVPIVALSGTEYTTVPPAFFA